MQDGLRTENERTVSEVVGTETFTTSSGTNIFISGSMTTGVASVTGNATVGDNVIMSAGSPFGNGTIVQLTARTIISGGQFVSASGNLAYSAPASTKWPIGIAEATAASGGVVNVITNGIAPAIAEGTIAIGAPAMMGAGGAQNCVVAATAGSGIRTFGVLATGGSEGTVFITL